MAPKRGAERAGGATGTMQRVKHTQVARKSTLSRKAASLVLPVNSALLACVCSQPVQLDADRFSALQSLLNKSEMYSTFVSEQIKESDARLDGDQRQAVPAPAPAKGKGKGKRAKRARDGEEDKGAGVELTPTQVRAAPGPRPVSTFVQNL